MRHFRQVSGALAEFPEFPDGIQCLFQVQFPSSSGVIRAVPVIKAVGGIAILLDFRNEVPGSNGMNQPRRNVKVLHRFQMGGAYQLLHLS